MMRSAPAIGIALAAVAGAASGLSADRAPQDAGVIAGRVADSSGAPISNAFVRAVEAGPPGTTYDNRLSPGDYTDDDGRYEIREVLPEAYWVFVEAPHVTHPTDLLRSRLLPPSAGTGRPAARFASEDGGFYSPASTLGPAVPPPLRPDGREAVFITTGYPSADDVERSTPVRVAPGQVRDRIDVTMLAVPRMRVRGIVLVPGVSEGVSWRPVLRLRGGNRPWSTAAITRARLDGAFEFLSAPPGDWTLEAYRALDGSDVARNDPRGMTAQMPLTVGDEDIEGLEVRLDPGATVRARLEFDGPPPADDPRYLSMRLGSTGRSLGNGEWTTTPEAFVATGVAPGAYRFLPRIDGWHLASVTHDGRDITGRALEVARQDVDDLVVAFTRHPAGVVGVVQGLLEADARDTRVVLFPADPERFAAASFERVEVSDVGAFAFRSVVPGTYFVAAVSEAALDDWPVPSSLEELARVARLVTVRAREMAMIDLERGTRVTLRGLRASRY